MHLEEYRRAEIFLKGVQVSYFTVETSALKKGHPVSPSSKLKFLNTFLDSDGIIRIGVRLSNTNLMHDHKFPIVLLSGCKITKLIFYYYHTRDFHVKLQRLLNTVRLKY